MENKTRLKCLKTKINLNQLTVFIKVNSTVTGHGISSEIKFRDILVISEKDLFPALAAN